MSEFYLILTRFTIVALIDVVVIKEKFRPKWERGEYSAEEFVVYQVVLFGLAGLLSLAWAVALHGWLWAVIIILLQALMVACGVEDILYAIIARVLGVTAKAFPKDALALLYLGTFPKYWPWLGHHEKRPSNRLLIFFAGEEVRFGGMLAASTLSLLLSYFITHSLKV